MSYIPADTNLKGTAAPLWRRGWMSLVSSFLCMVVFIMVSALPLFAQGERWEYQVVSSGTYHRFDPRIAIDRWGNSHVIWGAIDSLSSLRQLFYSSDVTGIFHAPLRVTDTGEVDIHPASPLTSWVLHLDARDSAHIAFPATVSGDGRIFHAVNSQGNEDFETAHQVNDSSLVQYDMAVDSLGYAHVVWTEYEGDLVKFFYWTSRHPSVQIPIPSYVCLSGLGRCRIGNPEIEVGPNGLLIGFRSDYGSLYLIRQERGNFRPAIKVEGEGMPVYDPARAHNGKADLRLRMAADSAGNVHFLYPHYDETRKHCIAHTSNASGPWATSYPNETRFDTAVADFDIAHNGVDRACAVWTVHPANEPAGKALIGFGELLKPELLTQWRRISDLNKTAGGDSAVWRDGIRIAAIGDRVVIAGSRRMPEGSHDEIGLIVRSSTRPEIRYILPDAAAPGMNVVVEAFAPARRRGSFGPDGFRFNDVTMEVANPSDTALLVFGPSIVSWDGRLVSTMVFVSPDATPGDKPLAVPVRIRVKDGAGDFTSNVDTFFIMKPVPSPASLNKGGVLGSKELGLGRRSKRGVLVVDSLILDSLTFTVDDTDTDLDMPGNQGFLPVTILSRGPIVIDTLATLSVSAWNDNAREIYGTAGPGGGGGGSGGFYLGGAGFTGGGGAINSALDSTFGTGGRRSGRWSGGPSLNGTPGGASFPYAPGGGGTGHPFGASGAFGRISPRVPIQANPGGYGGGSGGVGAVAGGTISGAGGGGHASPGDNGSTVIRNGQVVGVPQIVPLAGGSGGGGGYAAGGRSNGGGGGGAISLFSRGNIIINGNLEADGAAGTSISGSGGGGGAGGAIIIAAQGEIRFESDGRLSADGELGGPGDSQTKGGPGGIGRIRTDGKTPFPLLEGNPVPTYWGPAISVTPEMSAGNAVEISGAGGIGSQITVYVRKKFGSWEYATPYTTTVVVDSPPNPNRNGSWKVQLDPVYAGEELYVVAMQRVAKPQREQFEHSPEWVMSHASGIIIGQPVVGLDMDSLVFPCINFDSCVTAEITIRNLGNVADLIISDVEIIPTDGKFTLLSGTDFRVAARGTATLKISFCPGDIGEFEGELRFRTNLRTGDPFRTIKLRGCGVSGRVLAIQREINLGEICPGECRNTIVTLSNRGEGPLKVSGIVSRGNAIGVTINIPLPIEILPGSSVDIPLTLCPRRIDQRGSWLDIQANSIYPPDAIVVKGINIGPEFEIPEGVSFGPILIKGSDTCIEQLVIIKNLREKDLLKISSLALTGGNGKFSITPWPISNTTISPGDPLVLTVRFCSSEPGDFTANITMLFGGGECEVDTVIVLRGSAAFPAPQFVIEHPGYDTVSQCRSIRFPVTSVGGVSRRDMIEIRNRGTAAGSARWEWIERNDDFVIDALSGPMEVGQTQKLTVEYKPKTNGPSNARIRFIAEDGTWSDIVCLHGTGAVPGIRFLVSDEIDFGEVEVGDTTDGFISLYNDGEIAVTFTDLSNTFLPFEFVGYTVNGVPQSTPITLEPNGTTRLRLHYRFNPRVPDASERILNQELTTSDGKKIPFRVRGRGVLGRIVSDTKQLSFICLPGGEVSRKCFTLTNRGTYPLEILRVSILSNPGSRFTLVPEWTGPVVIPPGGSVRYCVEYAAGAESVEAQVLVEVAVPKQYDYERFLSILLTGEGCGVSDQQKITFSIPETSDTLGDIFYLPIQAKLALPTDEPILYAFELTYAYDILMPAGAPDVKRVDIEGTMTNFVQQYFEITPGQLLIGGEIREGSTEGTLLKIPFKVLLGSSYTTPVNFRKITIAIKQVSDSGGLFHALDCDTSDGGVLLLGPYALSQNRPNPFNPTTEIPYSIGKQARVRLNLYDATGTLVRVLLDTEQPAGDHVYILDASTLSSGVYTYELISGRFRQTRRMVLLE